MRPVAKLTHPSEALRVEQLLFIVAELDVLVSVFAQYLQKVVPVQNCHLSKGRSLVGVQILGMHNKLLLPNNLAACETLEEPSGIQLAALA